MATVFVFVITFCGMAMRNGWFGYGAVILTETDVVVTTVSVPTATNQSETVDLNTASAEELDQLSGVGPVIAQRIVDYREQNGPFTSVEQLTDVKGIGSKTLEKLKPYLVVTHS